MVVKAVRTNSRIRYPKGIHFKCQRCAKCCGDTPQRERNILLLETEVKRIAEAAKLRQTDFSTELHGGSPYRYSMKKRDGKCIFLNGNVCEMYLARPLICRFYPFSLERSASTNAYIFKVSDECPGIGLGNLLKGKEFKKMFDEALKSFSEE